MTSTPVFLLVEPAPILRSSLHAWLDRTLAGHRILVAADGMEALRLVAQERPSHILLEMELPQNTGFVVLRQMRHFLPDAKIIATSWFDNSFLLRNLLLAGADGFVRKNKVPRELLSLWDVPLK
jgi:DNA-binding NarL/FixJ family response regulator